jgi:8-oxo-dGTP diphosphatase
VNVIIFCKLKPTRGIIDVLPECALLSIGIREISSNIVHVAVGVVVQSGQVLICWRDASLHQGNRYEFPGGKVETGETPLQALKRELFEEIGIHVQQVARAQQLHFTYPEKTVCLHIFKVTAFSGQPRGQQNQAIRWVDKHELNQYQFPDANAPILRMVLLPDYYVITQQPVSQSKQVSQQNLIQWIDWHVQHTVQQAWLYVRHKQLDAKQYQQVIQTLSLQRPDLKLLAMASQVHALKPLWPALTGVHFSQNDLTKSSLIQSSLMQGKSELLLPPTWYCFAACHDAASIAKANALNMDAVLLSPLYATETHTGQAGLGWQEWQQLGEQSTLPVYALGGMTPDDLLQVQQAGGFGVAGIRAFYDSQINSVK